MKKEHGFSETIFTFGFYGAFGASLLFLLWTWLFQPRLFNDGQYGMVFLFTSPLGWLLGSVTGWVRGLRDRAVAKPKHSVLGALGLIIGGAIFSPLPGTMFMMLFLTLIGLLMELGRFLIR